MLPALALPELQEDLDQRSGWRGAMRKVRALLSWIAQAWAIDQRSSTHEWSRDESDRAVGKRTDVRLSPVAKLVLSALAERADKQTHSCWPAKERLAADIGASVRAVQAALKQLVEARLISRERRFKDGRQTSDLFTLEISPAWLAAREARGELSAPTRADTSPKPKQEPVQINPSSYLPTGSGEETAPLDQPKCERCGCRLAADHAFDVHCSPCKLALETRSMVVA